MKGERELIAAILTLVGAQTNRPRAQVMADYEAFLREVYDLQGRLRASLEHGLRDRFNRRPETPGGGGGGGLP